jgi:MraZ protein
MAHFLGTFTGGLDKKGRVSVPASFRAVLPQGVEGACFILRPAHDAGCIQGFTESGFDDLAESMKRMALFSADETALSYALYADAGYCAPDKEGRCVLKEDHIRHAGLSDAVIFVGLRNRFEIWEPVRYKAHRDEQLARARMHTGGLPQAPAGNPVS